MAMRYRLLAEAAESAFKKIEENIGTGVTRQYSMWQKEGYVWDAWAMVWYESDTLFRARIKTGLAPKS